MAYNPQMVTLARESRGLTQTALGQEIGLPQGTQSKIESGDREITTEHVRIYSKTLGYPVSFFEQTDPVYPFSASTFHHREAHCVPMAVLRRIQARANIYRHQVIRLLRTSGVEQGNRFRRVTPDEHNGKIEEVARRIRTAWGIGSGPIQNLTKALEDNGAIVIRFSFGTPRIFGMSEWIPPAPPMFFLNDHPEISAERDRSTLAHDLGHLLLHGLPNLDMEEEASRFAAEFLMPAEEIRPQFWSPIRLYGIAWLKPYWGVSMAGLIARGRDLGVIGDSQFAHLRGQLQRRGYLDREPAELDIAREQPHKVAELIRCHVEQLGYAYSEIARKIHMQPEEFFPCYHVEEDYPVCRAAMA